MRNRIYLAGLAIFVVLSMAPYALTDEAFICETDFDGLAPGEIPDDADLVVPPGGFCVLNSNLGDGVVAVEGDVTVSEDAIFVALGARIDGDVIAESAALVQILQDLFEPSPEARLTFIDGDIEITGPTGNNPLLGDFPYSITICETEVDGDIELKGIVGSTMMLIGDPPFCFLGVAVDGDVSILDIRNDPPIRISDNAIDGDLECENNVPPVSGAPGSNAVGGEATGECAALAIADDDDSDEDSDG